MFIQVQKGGKGRYAHLAASEWVPEKKMPRQVRTYLGRVVEVGGREEVAVSRGLVGGRKVTVPLSELKEQAKAGNDVLAYLVGEAEKRGKGGLVGDLPTGVQEVGCSHVLYRALEESGLGRALTEAYGRRDGLALALLGMQAVADGRPLYLAAHWIAESAATAGLETFDFSSPGLSRFMRRIGEDRESLDKFLGLWVAACGRPAALAMDTTSISTWAEELDLAEWGHNRDHEKLPQVNLALVCARETGTPLAYRLLRGSVPDVSSLKVTEELLAEYGLAEVSHALDRGFYSNANLRRMMQTGRRFVVGGAVLGEAGGAAGSAACPAAAGGAALVPLARTGDAARRGRLAGGGRGRQGTADPGARLLRAGAAGLAAGGDRAAGVPA